jgi:hypothetical protein
MLLAALVLSGAPSMTGGASFAQDCLALCTDCGTTIPQATGGWPPEVGKGRLEHGMGDIVSGPRGCLAPNNLGAHEITKRRLEDRGDIELRGLISRLIEPSPTGIGRFSLLRSTAATVS